MLTFILPRATTVPHFYFFNSILVACSHGGNAIRKVPITDLSSEVTEEAGT